MKPNKTLGEFRIRTEFNPSNDGRVDLIKQKFAELINLISSIEDGTNFCPDTARLKAIAITKIEESAMWSVKAATAN